MTGLDEMKHKFNELTNEEKMDFMKSAMPTFCATFSNNPERMMTEMMPLCRDLMMKTCNMEMQGMIKMMGMMGMMGGAVDAAKR